MGQFHGDFSIMSLADLFQHLVNGRKEGTLTVKGAEGRKMIYFGADGIRVLSEGAYTRVRIGDTLVRRKRITTAQLQRGLDEQKTLRCRLGEALIHLGFVSEREIVTVVREQIEEEIYDLFTWQHASFEFTDGPPPAVLEGKDEPVAALTLEVMPLLMEAARRLDEWKLIRNHVPDDEAVYRLNVSGQQFVRESADDPMLQRVAHLLDGQRTLGHVIAQSGFPRFEVYRLFYALHLQLLLETLVSPRPAEDAGGTAAPERHRSGADGPGGGGAAKHAASAAPAYATPSGLSRGVLIVGASPAARDAIAGDLRAARFHVAEASGAREGAMKLGLERLHAVIVDAGGDIAAALAELQALGKATSLPIFVLGTTRRREDIEALMRAGARDYLLKPVPAATLAERISKLWKDVPVEQMGDVTIRLQRKKKTEP